MRLRGLFAILFILGVYLLGLRPGLVAPAAFGAGSGYDLVDAVNQVRSANGLPAYRIDDALMAAAQGHSDHMAETGDVSHNGVGGSSPAGRAAAAGYSGSGVIENIMSGTGISPQQAVQWWQADGLHLGTLLSTAAQDAGGGAAVSGDVVYYTLLVGHKGGGSGRADPPAQQPASGVGDTASQPEPPSTIEVVISVQTVTPAADGSMVHVVQEGQTLWDIASAYKISLADLYAMNGFTDQTVIFPGEHVIAQLPNQTLTPSAPGDGPASSPSVPATARAASTQEVPSPSPTVRPTTEQASASETAPLRSEQTGQPATLETGPALTETSPPVAVQAGVSAGDLISGIDPFLAVIVVLAVLGAALILAGAFLKRSS